MKQELAKRLKAISAEMESIGKDMQSHGMKTAITGQFYVKRGREMVGASQIAKNWAADIDLGIKAEK